MLKRTVSGTLIAVVSYGVILLSGISGVLKAATAALCLFSVYELACAANILRSEAMFTLSLLGAAWAAFWELPGYVWLAGTCFCVSLPLFGILMHRLGAVRIDANFMPVLLIVLVCGQLAAMPYLRALPFGFHYLIIVVTVCFLTDVAAYLVGSRYGKRKLAPAVSPNKTIAGALAGLGITVVFCLAYGGLLTMSRTASVAWGKLILFALCIGALSQFGDLSMSAVKRICGIKDFGDLIPGHGGMLDRFDSHIFVMSFTYLFCVLTGGFLH